MWIFGRTNIGIFTKIMGNIMSVVHILYINFMNEWMARRVSRAVYVWAVFFLVFSTGGGTAFGWQTQLFPQEMPQECRPDNDSGIKQNTQVWFLFYAFSPYIFSECLGYGGCVWKHTAPRLQYNNQTLSLPNIRYRCCFMREQSDDHKWKGDSRCNEIVALAVVQICHAATVFFACGERNWMGFAMQASV